MCHLLIDHTQSSTEVKGPPCYTETYTLLMETDCFFNLLLCSLIQSVHSSKLLNLTSQWSQGNVWVEFHSSVILKPCCFSRLGTIPGMSCPAVLHTSRSCSGKCQSAQMGFDARLARECLCVRMGVLVGLCMHVNVCVNADGQPARVLICSHSDWSPKGRLDHLSVYWEGHYSCTGLRSQILVWAGKGAVREPER